MNSNLNAAVFNRDFEISNEELLALKLHYCIAKTIKESRCAQKLTQQELSEKSGVNRSTISLIEKYQRRASIETLLKLLDSLGLEMFIRPKES